MEPERIDQCRCFGMPARQQTVTTGRNGSWAAVRTNPSAVGQLQSVGDPETPPVCGHSWLRKALIE
jgi:hypothetical protein